MTHSEHESRLEALERYGLDFDRAIHEEERRQAGHRLRIATPRAGFLTACVVAVAVGLAFTPPGRALAEAVGALVGIGEPSSVQESDLRDPRLDRSQERVGPAIVAASGVVPTADGEPFEIVAWAATEREPRAVPVRSVDPSLPLAELKGRVGFTREDQRPERLLSCLGIVFPDRGAQETGKYCATTEPFEDPSHVFVGGGGPTEFGPTGPDLIAGTTAADVARVEVTYIGESGTRVEAPVTLGHLAGGVLEKTGATVPFGLFVAFIPWDGSPRPRAGLSPSAALQSVMVTTFDDAGRELGNEDYGANYSRALASSARAQRRREIWARCVELAREGASNDEVVDCVAEMDQVGRRSRAG